MKRYEYGNPFDTEAIVEKVDATKSEIQSTELFHRKKDLHLLTLWMKMISFMVLVRANRGINKRGYCYISDCSDDPEHTEDKRSLYAAHNFIIVSGKQTFGMFFDYPSTLTFDIGYTRMDTMKVSCENADLNLYVFEGENAYDIVKQVP